MYLSVKQVEPTDDYILVVEFEGGIRRKLDMKPYLNFGVFKRLRIPSAFKAVRVGFDTVEWASGVDLDPEFVYEKSEAI